MINKIGLIAILCGFLFACQQPTNQNTTQNSVETEEKQKLQLVYSNLVDTETQQEVEKLNFSLSVFCFLVSYKQVFLCYPLL